MLRMTHSLTLVVCWSFVAVSFGAETKRPNIILLESDDHHYQALGCMGDPVRTPNIDRLAARGVLFRNNVAQGTMCSPSRNALLTGAYPHNTGVYHNRDGNMAAGIWTFPQALRRAGYRTALVGKNHFKPQSEVAVRDRTTQIETAELRTLGFDYVHAMRGKVAAATSKNGAGDDPYCLYLEKKGLLEKLRQDYAGRRGLADLTDLRASPLGEENYQDTYIANQAIEYLASNKDERPFFLWVDFVAPHPPADAPEPYFSMHDPAQVRKPIPSQNKAPTTKRTRDVSEETYQKFRAAYYGMVTLLDAQVGRIEDALEKSGQLENTIIIFTGDQGSMLGDLGLFGKGVFYKGSINSPLVIAGPPGLVTKAVVDRPVQLIDVVPTILEWAGASSDDIAHCRGASLAPLLTGRGEFARREAFSEDATTKMIVNERYKYIASPVAPLLFDLQADPNETQNVIDQLPEIRAELKQKLEQWTATTGEVLSPNSKAPQRRK